MSSNAATIDQPTIPAWHFWARLFHRDHVGMEAGERKRVFHAAAGDSFKPDYVGKFCRPHQGAGIRPTGEPDPMTKILAGLHAVLDAFPQSRPDVVRLVSWLPNELWCDVVPRAALFGHRRIADAAAHLTREHGEAFALLFESMSKDSEGGRRTTPREALAVLPEVEDIFHAVSDLRLRLQQRASEAA